VDQGRLCEAWAVQLRECSVDSYPCPPLLAKQGQESFAHDTLSRVSYYLITMKQAILTRYCLASSEVNPLLSPFPGPLQGFNSRFHCVSLMCLSLSFNCIRFSPSILGIYLRTRHYSDTLSLLGVMASSIKFLYQYYGEGNAY